MSSENEKERPNEVMDDGVFRRPFPPSKKIRRQYTTTGPELENDEDEERDILMEVLSRDDDWNGFNNDAENWAGWYPLPWLDENDPRNIQGRAHLAKLLIN